MEAEKEKLDGQLIAEGSWKGFYSDEQGLFIEARNVRGMLKQAARANGGTKVVRAALKKLTDNLRIEPTRVHFKNAQGRTLREPNPSRPGRIKHAV